MIRFKKVLKKGSSRKSELTPQQKEDQTYYESKVEKLTRQCEKFKKSKLRGSDRLSKDFSSCFNEAIEDPKLFSRTKRVLKDMLKNIVKTEKTIEKDYTKKYGKYSAKFLNENLFTGENYKKYIDAFKFTPKKANKNDYISRSAIDDEEIVNFFSKKILKKFW